VTTPKKATKTTAKKTAAKTATPQNLRLVPGEDTGTAFEQVHRTGEDERRPGEYEQVPLDFDDEGRGSHD
jgi:hypothetical protein